MPLRTIIFALFLSLINLAHAEMPPLPEHRAAVYSYYKLKFLEDGYPGRETDHRIVPHPIYGTYVITDYLRSWRETGDKSFLQGAIKVGDAALKRMNDRNGALVFYYTPEMKLTSMPGTFYSGLTQGRYLGVFTDLWQATGDTKYLAAAERVLQSLLIPVKDGGVALEAKGGIVLEEWPHEVATYTLNGWTTTMLQVYEFYDRTGSEKAKLLFDHNLKALEQLLPLYDIENLSNSRYGLTGFVWMRLVFSDGFLGQIKTLTLDVGDSTEHHFLINTKNRWLPFIHDGVKAESGYPLPVTKKVVQINTLLSMISWPEPNEIHLSLLAERPGRLSVQILSGPYDPLASSLKGDSWKSLYTTEIKEGENGIDIVIPWEKAALVAYPTNFAKHIASRNYNVYHFIHIKNLRRIAAITRSPTVKKYADRWESYVRKWPTIPLYTQHDIELEQYTARPRSSN
ncbi:D-glucuronyl C5-epimerase family protein [Pusillimonas caeni]|uniref:D-glucuronyl C5-epimerase family protein n=1 Tax=Pusillimonas caeni TaxID=1348472 RepID=UPI00142FBED2|nr:D-glucuronyl C5-epimerase family protein [Pusillimonas caeni]